MDWPILTIEMCVFVYTGTTLKIIICRNIYHRCKMKNFTSHSLQKDLSISRTLGFTYLDEPAPMGHTELKPMTKENKKLEQEKESQV